ncbi:MAG TPA: hypothetical protein VLM43_06900, partial [Desulfobacterales bacterium]|nr:hypothetical protein [Desulfobacterales bacterium]
SKHIQGLRCYYFSNRSMYHAFLKPWKLPDSSTYCLKCFRLYMEFRVVSKQLLNDGLKHTEERGRYYEYECGGKDR